MPYPKISTIHVRTQPLAQRRSKSEIENIAKGVELQPERNEGLECQTRLIAERIKSARKKGAAVILMFGAHLIKNGVGPLLIKMMEEGWLTHLATQGAGCIHDWEFAFYGYSEEDVRENIPTGQFGAWEETGRWINLAVQVGAITGMGFGEAVGAVIENERLEIPDPLQLQTELNQEITHANEMTTAKMTLLASIKRFNLQTGLIHLPHPYKRHSVLAAAYRLGIPITIHCGIGYDIFFVHPLVDGGAIGRASHTDFQVFCHAVHQLNEGVLISIGSAVMAPQVFEKALSIVNNLRRQQQQPPISGHHIVINDLQPLRWDWRKGEPPKSSPDYYLRFLKSFYRTAESVEYIAADNRALVQHLYWQLKTV